MAWSELALAEIASLGPCQRSSAIERPSYGAKIAVCFWRGTYVAGLIPLVLPDLPSEVADALVATATDWRTGCAWCSKVLI